MRRIVTDQVALSVCLSVTIVSPAETSEPIEMSFELWMRVGPRKHVLDGDAHWRNLANTIELSMCGGDAVCLSNYFDHLLTDKFTFRCGQRRVMSLSETMTRLGTQAR